MNTTIIYSFATRTCRSKTPLTFVILSSTLGLASCGGGSSDSDPADLGTPTLDDATNLRNLNVSFDTPERPQLLGTTLTPTVMAGASEQPMVPVGTGFESTLLLPKEQQLLVYVGLRRADDGLPLAAANTTATAWLRESGATISLPEQLFVYDFDKDGDSIDNIIKIERGSSPTSPNLDFDSDGQPDDIDQEVDNNDGAYSGQSDQSFRS